MSSIKYNLQAYIDGSEKSDISLSTDGPFQAFHVGDQFVPDPKQIDEPGTGYKIVAIRHIVYELSGLATHTVELDLTSFTK